VDGIPESNGGRKFDSVVARLLGRHRHNLSVDQFRAETFALGFAPGEVLVHVHEFQKRDVHIATLSILIDDRHIERPSMMAV
jgi:hypothetical protein